VGGGATVAVVAALEFGLPLAGSDALSKLAFTLTTTLRIL